MRIVPNSLLTPVWYTRSEGGFGVIVESLNELAEKRKKTFPMNFNENIY